MAAYHQAFPFHSFPKLSQNFPSGIQTLTIYTQYQTDMFPTMSSSQPFLSSLLSMLAILCLIYSSTAQSGCNADNCLRAAKRSSAQIAPFCSSYLSTAPAATTTLPAFATTACSQSPSRISSACQCLFSSVSLPTQPHPTLTLPANPFPTPQHNTQS